MKSIIKEGNTSNKRFPKLMIRNHAEGNTVILMSGKSSGQVVYSENKLIPIGEYSTIWDLVQLEDFNGTIELSND